MALFGKLIVLLAGIFFKSNFGFDTGPFIYRKVVCREGRFDFKNVQCKHGDSEQPRMALHRVMFGYLNESANCTESEDTTGCEEPMSATQMTLMLQKGSAQPSLSAIQFPSVDAPKYCKDFGESPDYMAFTFECLRTTSIIEMCRPEGKTGMSLSVYNPGYPGPGHVPGTHQCICTITSPAPVIVFTLYDYRLNCTGNNQNLTINDDDGRVLDPVCDSLESGHWNSSSKHLTIVWEGEKHMAGLFWIGFQASDPAYNVTADCYPIWDPTTTTTTTSTSTTTTITKTSKPFGALSASSMTIEHTSPAVSTDPVRATSKTTIRNLKHSENQRKPLPKALVYSLIGGGSLILLVIVIICRVALKTRNNVEVIDMTQMDNIARKMSTDSKESRRSREVQDGGTKSEKERQVRADRGHRRASSSTSDTLDEKVTFEKVHRSQRISMNGSERSSKPDSRRKSAT